MKKLTIGNYSVPYYTKSTKDSVNKFFKLVNTILDYDRRIKYAFSDMEYDPVVATKNQFNSIHKNLVNELDEYFTKGVFKDTLSGTQSADV